MACSAVLRVHVQVQWIHKNSHRVLTSDDRIEIDDAVNEIVDGYQKYDVQRRQAGDQTTYMLIIRRLVLTDAGTYTCQINVKASHVHPSKDGVLVVLSTCSFMLHSVPLLTTCVHALVIAHSC